MSCGWRTSRPCARPAGSRRDKRVSMTTASGLTIFRLRRGAAALVLAAAAVTGLAPEASAQDSLSPLPPPVTRSQYRGQWFEFLSAFSENDTPAADKALEGMLRAGRKVGVNRLSDFSRTAVYLGHRAEKQGASERAARAYAAALKLDASNPDAILAHLSFLFRHGRIGEALRELPAAAAAYVSTREARVAILSSLGLWLALGIAGMFAGAVLALGVRHFPRAWHDISERAGRAYGSAAVLPFALLLLGLPIFIGLGPVWLLLYWGALLFPYTEGRERTVLAAAFVALALVPPLVAKITAANIEERSPLFAAALDLAERREDASAEDGLRQAAAVFPEDSDVWYLLGIFAERSGDLQRAQSDYGRAMQADPADYRPLQNRGNVRFTEGDYGEAIRDYIEAGKRAPAIRGGLLQPLPRPRRGLRLRRPGRRDPQGPRDLELPGQRLDRQPDSFPSRLRRLLAGPGAGAHGRVGRAAQEPAAAGPRQRPRLATVLPGLDVRSPRGAGAGNRGRAPARPGRRSRLRPLRASVLQALPPLGRPLALLRLLLEAPHEEGRRRHRGAGRRDEGDAEPGLRPVTAPSGSPRFSCRGRTPSRPADPSAPPRSCSCSLRPSGPRSSTKSTSIRCRSRPSGACARRSWRAP